MRYPREVEFLLLPCFIPLQRFLFLIKDGQEDITARIIISKGEYSEQ